MKTITNKKIFDINNPNCRIITPIEVIANLFNNVPVLLGINTDKKDEVFGMISKATSYDDRFIYGDIYIYNDFVNIGEMINYEVMIDDINKIDEKNYEINISSITCVCYERK